MQGSLLQPDEKRTGITFDPRTKMFLLLTVAVFVLGGAGGKNVDLLAPMLCVLPVVLFFTGWKMETGIYLCPHLCGGVSLFLVFRTTHHRHCKFPAAGTLRHLIPVPARNHAGHVFD